jgi:hypothetical protein
MQTIKNGLKTYNKKSHEEILAGGSSLGPKGVVMEISHVFNFAQNGELTANLRTAGCNLRSAKCQKARTFCPVWVS